jgi:PST family polysaccharide transporter
MNLLQDSISNYKNKFDQNYKIIIENFGWLSIDRIVRLAVNLVLFGWIARYLGPSQFGYYNYAIAFIALFNAFTTLGLQGIVVRDLVRKPNQKNEILGTVFGLKLIGAVIGFLFIVMIASLIHKGDRVTSTYVTIIAIGIFFQPFSTIGLWFQSQVKSKMVVISTGLSFILISLAYIVAISTQQDLITFLWIAVGSTILDGVGLLLVYLSTNNKKIKWNFKFRVARGFISQSWILILSGIGAMINLKIDQVMIGRLLNSSEVGVYSAAVKISEIWYFVPGFIVISVFPLLIKTRENDYPKYQNRIQHLYDLMVALALTVAIIVTIFSDFIINLIYGAEYSNSATILSIHIWAGIFVFIGEVLSKWIINENLLIISPIRHGAGGAINIVLNLFLIPLLGGVGAAIATIISYATSSYLVCFFHPETRYTAKMMTRSLLFPFRYLYIGITGRHNGL